MRFGDTRGGARWPAAAALALGMAAGCSPSTSGGTGGATASGAASGTGSATASSAGTGGGASSSTGGVSSSAASGSGATSSSAGSGGATSSSGVASASSASASGNASSSSASASSSSSSSGGGGSLIASVASGCGIGGTVAWDHTVLAETNGNAFALAGMAGGPLGHVVVSTAESGSSQCFTGAVVMNGPGVSPAPTDAMVGGGACASSVSPVAFDRHDKLLSGYLLQHSTAFGAVESGFSGESVSASVNGTNLLGPSVTETFLGADAAGNFFVQASSANGTPNPVDFGLGPVSGTFLLHYAPNGTLVSDTLPTTTGTLAVGALGDLFYATPVTGTLDDGCGPVGTAGTASTVLTERSATGACLWSRALPAATFFALDPAQNVLLATTFAGTVDFGGGPLASVGTSDLALAKLDPTGMFLWAKRFGASGATVSGISSFGATNAGGAVLSVSLGGKVDFGCGPVSSSRSAKTLVADFDAAGGVVFSRVVKLTTGVSNTVTDGLGGVSFAAQLPFQGKCQCTTSADCTVPTSSVCSLGMCAVCSQGPPPGDIVVSRFGP